MTSPLRLSPEECIAVLAGELDVPGLRGDERVVRIDLDPAEDRISTILSTIDGRGVKRDYPLLILEPRG